MSITLQQHAAQQMLADTTRRHFLGTCATGLGAMWWATQAQGATSSLPQHSPTAPLGALTSPNPGKVKRVIFLHLDGAPSQLELYDYKPELERLDGQDCPKELLDGKRFAFIKGTPQMLGPLYKFSQHGQSGAWVSELLPHIARQADDLCFIKTMQTDQFNHGPAQLMVHTGQARLGYPSIGSWVTWGLGTENQNLPGFIVLLSGGRSPRVGNSLWGAGFLPSVYQGVQCRSEGDPVVDVSNPQGVTRADRRATLDLLKSLNEKSYAQFGDPETVTRIAQYEMTYRMQMAVPEVMDISKEPEHIHKLYGTEPGKESFANNCLLARRLAESGVRYIQLYDWGWDSHGADVKEALNKGFKDKCREVDQASAALVADLKQRGMLEDTLVIWGGEFGRTPMRENRGGGKMVNIGRDHNPQAFTIWMAGGGVKPGFTYGETDPVGYAPVSEDCTVHLRDFHATLLSMMGFDHNKLTFPFQGLRQKLTGVKPAKVVKEILA
jgi:hypothetical protein